ncbi:MAG: MFS transporter [bacterium]|nr:MFS transporter [bacterium]
MKAKAHSTALLLARDPARPFPDGLRFVFLLFVYFLGMGSYLSSLSPYIVAAYGETSYQYFLASEMCYPAGYFLAGYLSDRTRQLRLFLVAGIALLAPAQFALFSCAEFPTLTLGLSGLTRMLLAANLQLMSIAVLEAIGEGPYARMRSAGTIGFAVFQLTLWFLPELLLTTQSGIATADAPRLIIDAGQSGRAGAFAFLACVPLALLVQRHRKSEERYRFADALSFSLRPAHLALLGLSFVFYFNFQLVDNYLGRFWQLHTGGMQGVYGGWFLAVLLEIPFLYVAAKLARSTGIRTLIFLSAGAGALRFAWVAATVLGFEPVPAIYSQLLHGIHFTGYHIGVIYWLRSSTPDHLYGSVYGLYNIITHSLGGMAGNVAFGALLFSGIGATLFESMAGDAATASPELFGFLPVFLLAAVLNLGVIAGFVFLRAPAWRTKAKN